MGGIGVSSEFVGQFLWKRLPARNCQHWPKEKLIVREVMSFVCTDSCETGIYTGTELEKGTGKSAFLEYLGFQSKCTGIVPV